MSIATYQGIVENGQIHLTPNVRLPEKARVYVVVPEGDTTKIPSIASPRLARPEQAIEFQKVVREESSDAKV